MSSLQPVRGTHDILPEENLRHRHIAAVARAIACRYGYGEITTPIFEFTEVFARTLGEGSDIVTKEMYSFTDKGGHDITLRPEGTAGIARAFISNGLVQNLPLKFFYEGPMFRHERPQKGRQRQFHQIGVELLGVENEQGDIETILLAAHILKALGVLDKATLEINTLGDEESRTAYRRALVDYFGARRGDLSEDSRLRLERNPLRILDSKDDGDRALIAGAPLFGDFLTSAASAFFDRVRQGLGEHGVAYVHNPRLVRGLDYYGHTAFEFTTTALGAQGTLLAGGRYDGLIAQMGGAATPGIGWAAGIERLALLIEPPVAARPLCVIPVGEGAASAARHLTQRLRHEGYVVELGFSGNVGKRMKRANKLNACAALILGEDEMAQGVVTLRDLDSGNEEKIPENELLARLLAYRPATP